jgi:hypothetical protein
MGILTIQNVRKDISHDSGYLIGDFRLIDGGLSFGVSITKLEYPHYTFFWSYKDEPRRFKVVIKRESGVDKIDSRSKYHRLWIEDLRMGVRIYDGHVNVIVFTDRKKFYQWMVDRILEYM